MIPSNLFSNPFAKHINLETALVVDQTAFPIRTFLKDEITQEKYPIPGDFLLMGIKYGVSGGCSGRKITSTMFDEMPQYIDIFEHSLEVPPVVMRHYEMSLPTALEFFREGKYEIGVCMHLVCYKGGDYWLIKLSPFYAHLFDRFKDNLRQEKELIATSREDEENDNFVFQISAHQLPEKDVNGAQKWEFDFIARDLPDGLLESATSTDIYRTFLADFL